MSNERDAFNKQQSRRDFLRNASGAAAAAAGAATGLGIALSVYEIYQSRQTATIPDRLSERAKAAQQVLKDSVKRIHDGITIGKDGDPSSSLRLLYLTYEGYRLDMTWRFTEYGSIEATYQLLNIAERTEARDFFYGPGQDSTVELRSKAMWDSDKYSALLRNWETQKGTITKGIEVPFVERDYTLIQLVLNKGIVDNEAQNNYLNAGLPDTYKIQPNSLTDTAFINALTVCADHVR